MRLKIFSNIPHAYHTNDNIETYIEKIAGTIARGKMTLAEKILANQDLQTQRVLKRKQCSTAIKEGIKRERWRKVLSVIGRVVGSKCRERNPAGTVAVHSSTWHCRLDITAILNLDRKRRKLMAAYGALT